MKTKFSTPQPFISTRRRFIRMLTTAGVTIAVLLISSAVFAQSGKKDKDKDKEKDGPNSQQLEIRMTKAEECLLKEYMEVAKEYLKKGDQEEALTVLKRVEHINPKMDGLKQEMDRIGEELMQENEAKVELDVSKGWGNPVCEVTEGKTFRLAATGEYKLIYSTTIRSVRSSDWRCRDRWKARRSICGQRRSGTYTEEERTAFSAGQRSCCRKVYGRH